MTHSLLWHSGHAIEGKTPRREVDDALLAALSLDRALTMILPDVAERRALAAILTEPPPGSEDVVWRQAVMRDFLDAPGLLDTFTALASRLSELKKQADDGRRVAIAAQSRSGEEALFSGAKSRLQMAALSLRRLLLLLREADAKLSTRALSSAGLREIVGRIHAIANAPGTSELLMRLAPLCDLSESADFRFALALDGDGRVAEVAFLDRAPIAEPQQPAKKRLFGGRRPEPTEAHNAVLTSPAQTVPRRLVGDGLSEAALAVERVCAALFAEFSPLSRELTFFAAGLRFSAFFAGRGLPTSLPALTEDGSFSAVGIYDPYLAAALPAGAAVVQNDLDFPAGCPGLIVTGANNAGKTVYLRALGSVVLLGQAGFPVCAASAMITPGTPLRSLFASAERIERAGSEAGRFEEEVRGLAAVIDAALPGELLLLNEPFQTTAYAEGAEGLGDILRYLGARGTRFALVTHLAVPVDGIPDAHRLVCSADHRVGKKGEKRA